MLAPRSALLCALAIFCYVQFASAGAFSRMAGGRTTPMYAASGTDVGEPLLLSDVLQNKGADEARAMSKVVPPLLNLTSYSGFLRTDQDGKEMFFWYFPPLEVSDNAPLLIWLQGGPGGSSMFGLFAEMGPIRLDASLKPSLNKYTWNTKYGMLFIDNPVGAGFSFTNERSGYCTNSKDCVADNLVSLMIQFYKIFPELKSSDLFITGESYGGHYVPAFGAKILQHNSNSEDQIPLKGVAIGDGWIDPVNMIPAYPNLMRNLGLANDKEVSVIQDYCDRSVGLIQQGNMLGAFNLWDEMLNGDIFPYPNYFHNITGSNNYDNLMMTNNPPDESYFAKYLNQPDIRKAIHVGDACFGCNAGTCEKNLMSDFHVSLRPELESILKKGLRVLVYSGQLDIIIASALTERFLPYLEWQRSENFLAAPKKVWRVEATDVEVAGFVQEVPGFQRVVVRGAGHIVPFDQPRRSLDMITRFVEGLAYTNQPDPAPSLASLVV
mmetsp:Transcript_65976/g.103844  ORF Transcript_65976/g.103844 Transcript_65976/m.103844 type:complete len:494 (-) Transcript_65976:135-1616(-)